MHEGLPDVDRSYRVTFAVQELFERMVAGPHGNGACFAARSGEARMSVRGLVRR